MRHSPGLRTGLIFYNQAYQKVVEIHFENNPAERAMRFLGRRSGTNRLASSPSRSGLVPEHWSEASARCRNHTAATTRRSLRCKIAQNGENGDWEAEGPGGEPLFVQTAKSAGFEILSPGETEGEGDPADPEIVGTAPPGALDALRRKFTPRAAHDRRLTSQEEQGRRPAYQ